MFVGNTINVATDAFSNFGFVGATLSGTNPTAAGNTQTFIAYTNPTPYLLSSGTYTFNNWPSTSATETYPANMIFHYVNSVDPTLTSSASIDYVGAYSLTGNAQIYGQGTTGFVFYNKGGANLGEAVLGINTTGIINVQVSWMAGTYLTGVRTYAIRGQYRIGTSGSFTDLPNTAIGQIEDTSSTTAGTYTNFGPISLPSSCYNQSNVQIRWICYYAGTVTGTRPQMNVTNISVTGNAPSATITGTATICTGTSTLISVSGGTPGATITLSDGSTFTLDGSGNGSGSVHPTTTTTYTATVTSSGVVATASGSVVITVNPLPSTGTITGASSVCVGSTVTLSDVVSSGTWSSSNTSFATVGSTTGIVSGIANGTVTINYTLTNSCGSASATFALTVNPTPTVFTVTGGGGICGSTGVHIGLSGSQSSVSYQLYLGGSMTLSTGTGTNANGGNLDLSAGSGFIDGGSLAMKSGSSNGLGSSGEIRVQTADSVNSGAMHISTGSAKSSAGSIYLQGGASESGSSSVYISGGDSKTSAGNVILNGISLLEENI